MRIYRASSLGYSLERLVAPHLGYEPLPTPEWLQEKFDEGTALEPVVLNFMRERHWQIDNEQEEVNLDIVPGHAIIQGHIDGMGWHPSLLRKKYVIEVKTMVHKSFMDFIEHGWGSKSPLIEKYKWQASVYMLATGLPHIMVAWDKDSTDKDDDDVRVWVVTQEEPFYLISDLANKVLEAEKYVKEGIIPEGCTDYPCPYFNLHAPDSDSPEQADNDLDGLLSAWLEADRQEKAYKKEKDTLREAIVEYVGDTISGKVKGSQGVTVSTTWIPEKEVNYKVKPHWETRITAPRRRNG